MDRQGLSLVRLMLIILINILIFSECSAVVSRQEWGAELPRHKRTMRGSARRVIIHHTAGQSCRGLTECKRHLISIQRDHINRNFGDIGYNFLVGRDGTVFEGRGWGVVGAHAKGQNSDSVGIAFMGNFNNETPSTQAITSVKQLLQSGVSQGFLQPQFVLSGHRDVGTTECPGENLYAALQRLTN
ncbi:peptidoglycan-recognition protein SC2-like [Mugil cephalus]|uniref:peptidoglycan-recognition protein SC2-like n=1 Tax=Mugil cephalus TaxID=48193 RepID=UPI001FB7B699|nr:peptidoglycan-recognition protein SC2-like [Mugil cephalus]